MNERWYFVGCIEEFVRVRDERKNQEKINDL